MGAVKTRTKESVVKVIRGPHKGQDSFGFLYVTILEDGEEHEQVWSNCFRPYAEWMDDTLLDEMKVTGELRETCRGYIHGFLARDDAPLKNVRNNLAYFITGYVGAIQRYYDALITAGVMDEGTINCVIKLTGIK